MQWNLTNSLRATSSPQIKADSPPYLNDELDPETQLPLSRSVAPQGMVIGTLTGDVKELEENELMVKIDEHFDADVGVEVNGKTGIHGTLDI